MVPSTSPPVNSMQAATTSYAKSTTTTTTTTKTTKTTLNSLANNTSLSTTVTNNSHHNHHHHHTSTTPTTKASTTTTTSSSSSFSGAALVHGGVRKSSSRSAKEDDSKSLVVSTRKFYDLLCESQDFSVNLNDASLKLDLPKRRLYDITNVLEGINLLRKTSKNVIEWSGEYKPNSNATPIVRLENDGNNATNSNSSSSSNNKSFATSCLNSLKQEYEALEEHERQIVKDLQEYLLSPHAYVSYNDIKSCFGDQIVIAVKAPPGSSVYVFDQSEIRLKSELGPIEAYLCPSSPSAAAASNHHNQQQTPTNNNQANKTNSINETPMNNNTNSSNNTTTTNSSSKTFIGSSNSSCSHPSNTNSANSGLTTPSDNHHHNHQHNNHQHHHINSHNPSTSLPPPSSYASISSDEGRGTDHQHDPTLSSVSFSEEDALNFSPFDTRPDYIFGLDYNCAASAVFLDDNDGLYE